MNLKEVFINNSIYWSLFSPIPLIFSMVISFVLMTLHNVQDYIENPFDQEGLDDLKIHSLKVDETESF